MEMYIKPWSKEAERIFQELQRNRSTYSENIQLSREIGRHCKDLIDNDFLDISRSEKKRRTWYNIPHDVGIMPDYPSNSQYRKFMKFKFFKIY